VTAKQGTATVTPRLRFPEFRGGKAWEMRPLSKILSIGSGKDYKHLSSGPVPVYGSGGYMLSVSDYLHDGESVCIGRKGTINNPIFLSGKFWTVDTLFYTHSFKGCLPRFAFLHFQQIDWLKHNEAGGVPSLSKANIEKIRVSVPDLTEQQKIVACLTSLDEVIAAQGRKVEALKAHKRGLMQQLFPREGETRPLLRFPEFRDAPEWVIGKASDIVEVLQGYGFPERLQGSSEGEFPFYKVSDISACVDAGGTFLSEARNHINAAVLHELRAKAMPAGTTVFAKIGEAIRSNKRAITTRPCLVDNNVAGVKAIKGVAEDNFVYYLWSQVSLIEHAGGVVPAVNKSTIERTQVCYPAADEQRRIADCLSSLDSHIASESSILSSLKSHKMGLTQQLFPMPAEG
jgi:type I restriction enzyme, S subunit